MRNIYKFIPFIGSIRKLCSYNQVINELNETRRELWAYKQQVQELDEKYNIKLTLSVGKIWRTSFLGQLVDLSDLGNIEYHYRLRNDGVARPDRRYKEMIAGEIADKVYDAVYNKVKIIEKEER
jgi:hypothetical protein